MAAAGVPVVALLAIAATELTSLSAEKSRMQDTADAVALDAANQLSFSPPSTALARAEANAREQLASMQPRTTLTFKAELIEEGKGVRLAVNGSRLSFFGNMLPPGGFKTAVNASAVAMNTAPLCVVMLDGGKLLEVKDSAKVDAGECLVHSNGDVRTSNGGELRAYSVQAGGSASGTGFTPGASTGAAPIADPFASQAIALPSGCATTNRKFTGGVQTLPAGRHCGHLDIGLTTVRLSPGVHVFNGEVQLKIGTRLEGDGVLLVFEEGAGFTIDDDSVRLNLLGLKGANQPNGFVFAASPTRTSDISLPAKSVERLEGVVYTPKVKLVIDDGRDLVTGTVNSLLNMGAQSKWTVLIARELKITESADMVVNTDYLASNVPVPAGVGNKVGRNIRLLQ
jgi:hypothetical protein